MITRTDVQKAVVRYQRALESIGIQGAATIQWGSRPNGVSHVLEFRSPDLQHPEVEVIGRTYVEAERFVCAMAAAIEAAARAMKRRDGLKPRPAAQRSFVATKKLLDMPSAGSRFFIPGERGPVDVV